MAAETTTITLTGDEATRALIGARTLAGGSDPNYRIPGPAGLALRRIIRTLLPIVQDLEEERRMILARYGLRRNGKLLESDGGTPIPPERAEDATREVRALYAATHDVTVRPIAYSAFEGRDLNSSALADLGDLLLEDEEQEA